MPQPAPAEPASLRLLSRRLTLVLLGIVVPLIVAALLTAKVVTAQGHGPGVAWDQTILNWYRQRRTPALNSLALTLSVMGNLAFLPLTALLLAWRLWTRAKKSQAWFLVLSVGGSILLNLAQKAVYQRPRPDPLRAVVTEPGFSFPSGHAMTNAAFGLALVYIFWPTRYRYPAAVLGLGWAVLIGVCRNYLGVHYPSDVAVGQLSSLIWDTLLYLVLTRRSGGWPPKRALSPDGLPAIAPAER